ncbi:MAG: hypothetical protein IJ963_05805 [Phascolarctobacterium sp.]|nr:hypothetical protein [Phascolarctobacterium sp.]MBR6636910.1 hypothetical protein [Phascolarctobacterium sp.]
MLEVELKFFSNGKEIISEELSEVQKLLNRIDRALFFPQYSPNQKYAIAWRKRGFCIVNAQTMQYHFFKKGTSIERGLITDNGTFVVEDWMNSNKLNGRVFIGQFDSNMLLSRQFTANILEAEINPDGTEITVQLCGSKTKDSNKCYRLNLVEMQWKDV